MVRRLMPLTLVLCAALATSACGRADEDTRFVEPAEVEAPEAPEKTGRAAAVPSAATKNTTRLPGADPAELAADAALAVYPSATPASRPAAVTLVDQRDWRTALAASSLMGPPLRAPMLLTDPDRLPTATGDALAALDPAGSAQARGAQIIRVGTTPRPEGLRPTDITAADPAATAAAVDSFLTSTRGAPSRRVVVVSADDPAYAMPAAAWAAKSGDPILFASRNAVPAATRTALRGRRKPEIVLLGPPSVVSPAVERSLRALGEVTRVDAPDPIGTSIAFARFADGDFGWGVIDPGHGLVFARSDAPLAAAAVSALSAAGTYGPLILLDGPDRLPSAVRGFLLDIQPGYEDDPVRGVYNRGWLAGADDVISPGLQAEIDALLEIQPVRRDGTDRGAATTPTTTPTAPASTTITPTATAPAAPSTTPARPTRTTAPPTTSTSTTP